MYNVAHTGGFGTRNQRLNPPESNPHARTKLVCLRMIRVAGNSFGLPKHITFWENTMKHFVLATLLAAGFTDTIRATSSFGPSHVLATDGYPALFKKLSELTDGRWTGNDTPSDLLAPNEMNTGLRIRSVGALFTRFVESMGAEPVQMPASELFEALNSGVIDATYSSVGDLKNAQFYDVVKC